MQLTWPSRSGCNPRLPRAGSLSLGREAAATVQRQIRNPKSNTMKTRLISHGVGFSLLIAAAAWGQGGQFSFTADFLTPPNEANTTTNVWQYFYRIDIANRTGVYERLTNYDTAIHESGTEGWRAEADNPPYIGKHTSTDSLFPYIGLGESHIHPDNDGRGIAIGFQTPSNGFYAVSGSVRAAGGGSINWYLDKGSGSNVLASGSHLSGGRYHNFYAPHVTLAAGEFVFLVVDDDGVHSSDSTAIEFVVRPATVLLNLGSGLD